MGIVATWIFNRTRHAGPRCLWRSKLIRERIDATLPFVIENLATLEDDEIYEI